MTTAAWFVEKWKGPREDVAEAVNRLAAEAGIGHQSAWKIAHGYSVAPHVVDAAIRLSDVLKLGLTREAFLGAPTYKPPSYQYRLAQRRGKTEREGDKRKAPK